MCSVKHDKAVHNILLSRWTSALLRKLCYFTTLNGTNSGLLLLANNSHDQQLQVVILSILNCDFNHRISYISWVLNFAIFWKSKFSSSTREIKWEKINTKKDEKEIAQELGNFSILKIIILRRKCVLLAECYQLGLPFALEQIKISKLRFSQNINIH